MLRWRLLLSAIIIPAVAGLFWLDAGSTAWPGAWLIPLAVVLALVATNEVLQLVARTGPSPAPWSVYLGNALIVLSAWLPLAVAGPGLATPNDGAFALATLGLSVFFVFLGEVRRFEKPGGVTANIAAGTLALVYVGAMMAVIVNLRMTAGLDAVITLIVVVKAGDIGAYTIGRLFGRHQLAPVLSPKKTVEGAVGHLAFACLGAWGCLAWVRWADCSLGGITWRAVVFGLMVGAAGMFGDLAESLVKRDVGCKDSSSWLPGFGGVLDLLDSVLLAAPVAWVCWIVIQPASR